MCITYYILKYYGLGHNYITDLLVNNDINYDRRLLSNCLNVCELTYKFCADK